MRKTFLILLFLTSLLFVNPNKVVAAGEAVDCKLWVKGNPSLIAPVDSVDITIDGTNIPEALKQYPSGGELYFTFPNTWCGDVKITNVSRPSVKIENDGNPYNWCDDDMLSPREHSVKIIYKRTGVQSVDICSEETYKIEGELSSCNVISTYSGTGDVNDTTRKIEVSDIQLASGYTHITIEVDGVMASRTLVPPGTTSFTKDLPSSTFYAAPDHVVAVFTTTCSSPGGRGGVTTCTKGPLMCKTGFEIAEAGATPIPSITPIPTPTIPSICSSVPCNTGDCTGQCNICPGCSGYTQPTPIHVAELKPLCEQIDDKFTVDCNRCQADGQHIWTAIGCLPTDWGTLISEKIFPVGTGIAAGVAFLYFLYGVFLILTSGGNAEKIAEGKEIIISALSGLFLIIFSVFLLRVIGYDILKIPGFG